MIYVSSLVLLVLVRTPFGTSVKGAQRWFELFGFQLAPSEVAKLALIAMLAAFLSELRGDLYTAGRVPNGRVGGGPRVPRVPAARPRSSIVFVAILSGCSWSPGSSPLPSVLAPTAVVLIVAGFQVGLVREYQIERLQAFLDPASVSADALHNREQAEIAIGSGGLTGVGFEGIADEPRLRPRVAHRLRLHGHRRGVRLRARAALLGLYGILLWARVPCRVASAGPVWHVPAAGIASMFALQMFVNVGMNVGIMPITGIPLPFVSYGGSSLLLNLASVGLLLNVHMRRFT